MTDYVDRLPATDSEWFLLTVMRTAPHKWDWIALMVDRDPDETRAFPWLGARECYLRIPGKHKIRDAAEGALEGALSTRH
jgi:hypothetical protein